jgi:arsenate reductase
MAIDDGADRMSFPVTIWHNPACGASRTVLAMIRAAGHEPEVVEYLRTGWDRAELASLLQEAGLTPRDALRAKGTSAESRGLLDPAAPASAILEAMLEDPALVNRPFVRTPRGVRLARPSDAVLDLLDRPLDGPVK